MLYEYYFQGRKPSNAQVLAKINEGIKDDATIIEISWGENMITLDKQLFNGKREAWVGYGWIRNIAGSDLANHINKVYNDKFMKDHFQFIHVGG
jgi:hypothetical protein